MHRTRVVRAGARVLIVGAMVVGAAGVARAGIYEGFAYDAGDQFEISPGTGTGWAADSGYSGPLAIVSPTLTHPAALASTGNALGTTDGTTNINTSRPFASSLDSTQTTWMSFLGRRDADYATYVVALQQHSGNRTFSAYFGVDVDSSTGEKRYKARWENVGFSVSGGDAFASRDLSPLGTTDLFLVRIDPADAGSNSQTFDMWVNPDVSNLGSPDASVTWPSAFRLWSSIEFGLSGATVDELRIDPDMGNVVSAVPSPSAAGALLVPLAWRRRRAVSR